MALSKVTIIFKDRKIAIFIYKCTINPVSFSQVSRLIINCQDIQRNAFHDLQMTNGDGKKKKDIARINYPIFLYNF